MLLFLILNFSCVSFAKPGEIIYLIPENFTGGVIIVFNQPDGITLETDKDGTIIYRVPKECNSGNILLILCRTKRHLQIAYSATFQSQKELSL